MIGGQREQKAMKRARRVVYPAMSDNELLSAYFGFDSEDAPLHRRYTVEVAKSYLLERMKLPATEKHRRTIEVTEGSECDEAIDAVLSDRLSGTEFLGLAKQVNGFCQKAPEARQWRLVLEICKSHIHGRLRAADQERNSSEYSRAKAIDYILERQFQTDIETLNHYIWEPIYAHENGGAPLEEGEIEDIKARIFHGRMVIAACDLKDEAGYTRLKDMKPSDYGGKWDYGRPLDWVRAFLGHALEFEYKLRRGAFDTFTPVSDDERPGRFHWHKPPPKL